MSRAPLLLIIAAFVVLGGAVILAQTDQFGSSVSNDDGVRVDAPGAKVESDRDSTRIQAPGVDITVPKNRDSD